MEGSVGNREQIQEIKRQARQNVLNGGRERDK
jgi:hypothetical protein